MAHFYIDNVSILNSDFLLLLYWIRTSKWFCEWRRTFSSTICKYLKIKAYHGCVKKKTITLKLCTSLSIIIFSAWCVHDDAPELQSALLLAQPIYRRKFELWRNKRVQILSRERTREKDPTDLQKFRNIFKNFLKWFPPTSKCCQHPQPILIHIFSVMSWN